MKTEYIKGKTQRDLIDEIQERSIKEFSKTHRIFIRTMRTIVKYFGEDWEQIIYDNPYRIMEIDGFGFRRADKIAMKIGHPKDSLHRIKAYVEVAIMDTSNGSTVVPTGKIVTKIGKDLELDNPFYIIEAVFEQEDNEFLMLDENFFRTTDVLQCVYMTTKSWYETEKNFYSTMKELSNIDKIKIDKKAIGIVKKQLEFKLNEKQEYLVDNILNKNINILIGKAGCGKSYATKAVLDVLDAHHLTYTLMTPTGISSSVLTDKTGRQSSTIHARYYDRDWGNGGAIIPIEDDYIIVDEFGMCGVDHIRMILQMIEDRYVPPRLLFIGDIGQLASISAGDFLANIISLINRGMIDGQVIELTQIMRTASDSFIPFLCSMFYGNNYFDNTVIERNDMAGVEMIELKEEEMASQIFDIVQDRGFDMDETAIIMPQRVGDAGCNIVNEYFQTMNNNPILYKDKFRMFKKDDALMHVKNNYKMGIFNGERINLKMESDGEYICTKVADYSNLIYDEDLLKDQTMLSYANTTFKLQGCTVKNVIFVCNYDKHAFMLNKNLVYTSMSRASEKLIVLYNRGSLDRASQKTLVDKRSTFLGKLLELKK